MADEIKNSITRTRSWFYTLRTIFLRELKSYLGTPFGWVILACAIGLQGFWLQAVLQTMSKASGESVMYYMLDNVNFWFFFIFIFPLITMRTMAEEESHGTLEGLLTAPVTTTQIILGKYFAALLFYIVLWTPMLLYPWVSDLGNLYTNIRTIVIQGKDTFASTWEKGQKSFNTAMEKTLAQYEELNEQRG